MATVDQARHPSHVVRHIVLGLIAVGLALVAAYLWFTDGSIGGLRQTPATARAPIPQTMTPAMTARPAPVAEPPVPAQRVADPPVVRPAADAPPSESVPPPAVSVDPQIAADAAAAGMTSRARPAPLPAK
jgi:hypothetical protein